MRLSPFIASKDGGQHKKRRGRRKGKGDMPTFGIYKNPRQKKKIGEKRNGHMILLRCSILRVVSIFDFSQIRRERKKRREGIFLAKKNIRERVDS